MPAYAARRIIATIPVMLVVAFFVFSLLYLAPGDPAAIIAGDQTWRQFTPFELVWAGGVAGRVAIQMRAWIKRLRDRIAERGAQAREIAHRQTREAEIAREAEARAAQAHKAIHS